MKNEIKEYINHMNEYNKWEEEYKKKNQLTPEQKIKQYLELMELAYMIVPKERIEMLYQKKLDNLIKEKKMLMEGYKKYNDKISENQ